jgi:hypothetical protein
MDQQYSGTGSGAIEIAGKTADRLGSGAIRLAGSSVWVEPARRGPRLTAAQRLVCGHMHAGDQG